MEPCRAIWSPVGPPGGLLETSWVPPGTSRYTSLRVPPGYLQVHLPQGTSWVPPGMMMDGSVNRSIHPSILVVPGMARYGHVRPCTALYGLSAVPEYAHNGHVRPYGHVRPSYSHIRPYTAIWPCTALYYLEAMHGPVLPGGLQGTW